MAKIRILSTVPEFERSREELAAKEAFQKEILRLAGEKDIFSWQMSFWESRNLESDEIAGGNIKKHGNTVLEFCLLKPKSATHQETLVILRPGALPLRLTREAGLEEIAGILDSWR